MKKVILELALVAFAMGSTVAVAQTEDDYMKQHMEATSPGKHHEAFKNRVGEWKGVIKLWTAGPGTEPMESEATSTYKLVLDGRFLMQEMQGQIMGMPFVGMGVSGFDKAKGKHTAYWIDSMGTQAIYTEGECADHCKKETYEFTTLDPVTGATNDVKMTTVIKDDNTHVFEWYQKMPDGNYAKTMEITYTRTG